MKYLVLILLAGACSSNSSPKKVMGGNTGRVLVAQDESLWLIDAGFTAGTTSKGSCITTAGHCQSVDYNCIGMLAVVNPAPVSAGAITVMGNGMTVTLPPDGEGSYNSQSEAGNPFPPDTVMMVSAAGAAVPAFSGSVTMPSPAAIADLGDMIPRDQDLTVNWTGGSAGATLRLSLTTQMTSDTLEIDCSFDAAAGTDVVPAQLLSLLPATAQVRWEGVGVDLSTQAATGVSLTGEAYASGIGYLTLE
jgi:hypothetical protein